MTGNYYHQWDVVICGACYRRFLDWLKGHMKRHFGKLRFYDYANGPTPRPGEADEQVS